MCRAQGPRGPGCGDRGERALRVNSLSGERVAWVRALQQYLLPGARRPGTIVKSTRTLAAPFHGKAYFFSSASQFMTRVSVAALSVTQFSMRKRPSLVTS
jgi:hypothetical protein